MINPIPEEGLDFNLALEAVVAFLALPDDGISAGFFDVSLSEKYINLGKCFKNMNELLPGPGFIVPLEGKLPLWGFLRLSG